MTAKTLRVCFFGSYNRQYPRNKILIDGLEKNQVRIFHCQARGFFIRRYFTLIKKYWPQRHQIDVIFVAFPGHLDILLAWILGRLTGKKIVFDIFYSMYDTYVFDRQSATPKSIRALSYWLIDKISLQLPDRIITDTKTHGAYLSHLFHIPGSKFFRVMIGADDRVFLPAVHKKKNNKILIEFHGMFTRMHGVEYIIQTAKLLEKYRRCHFKIIGDSQVYTYPYAVFNKLQPQNLSFTGKMNEMQLAKAIQQADITLGHFGLTDKARNVISNKTYEGIASKKPVIVLDSPANRELFEENKSALFVKAGDTKDLAKKILLLVNQPKMRQRIAENGYQLFLNRLTNAILGKELKQALIFTHA